MIRPAKAAPFLLLAASSAASAQPRLNYNIGWETDSSLAGGNVSATAPNGRLPSQSAPEADGNVGLDVSGSIGATSDYRFRGVSLSNGHPVPQAAVSLAYRGMSAGVWTSRISRTAGGSRQEVDLSLAATGQLMGIDLTATGLLYLYPGDRDAMYGELALNASRSFGRFTPILGFSWAPPQPALGGEGNYYLYFGSSLETRIATLSAMVGREWGAFAPGGKWDWSVTASREVGPVNLSLSYVDSDARVANARGRNLAEGTAVLGISLNY